MVSSPNPAPASVTAGKPSEACKPGTEFYKSKALKVVAVLAVLSLAIAMIVGHFSGKSAATAGQAGGPAAITYSSESPIYFGPSKRVEIELKPDEWSPLIIAPERCKSVMGAVNPPVGYFIQFPDGKEIEVTPHGREGFLPAKRGEYRFRAKQIGQKMVLQVTY